MPAAHRDRRIRLQDGSQAPAPILRVDHDAEDADLISQDSLPDDGPVQAGVEGVVLRITGQIAALRRQHEGGAGVRGIVDEDPSTAGAVQDGRAGEMIRQRPEERAHALVVTPLQLVDPHR
jgi:hypothetical protein